MFIEDCYGYSQTLVHRLRGSGLTTRVCCQTGPYLVQNEGVCKVCATFSSLRPVINMLPRSLVIWISRILNFCGYWIIYNANRIFKYTVYSQPHNKINQRIQVWKQWYNKLFLSIRPIFAVDVLCSELGLPTNVFSEEWLLVNTAHHVLRH